MASSLEEHFWLNAYNVGDDSGGFMPQERGPQWADLPPSPQRVFRPKPGSPTKRPMSRSWAGPAATQHTQTQSHRRRTDSSRTHRVGSRSTSARAKTSTLLPSGITREALMEYPPMKSAMAKVGKAAMLYDRDRSITGLIGFEQGPSMTPAVLKDQLWRNFRLRLTPKELGCVVRLLDKDGDGTVDGAEFLCEFFKLGAQEKTRTSAKRREEEKRRQGKQKRLEEKWLQKFAPGFAEISGQHPKGGADPYDDDFYDNELLLPDRDVEQMKGFTDAQMRMATEKLGDVAATYSSKGRGPKVTAFLGASMTHSVFKDQLRRNFGLVLTPGEMKALISQFDKDGDGTIDGGEFLNTFFKLGRGAQKRRWEQERRHQKERADRERRFTARAKAKYCPPPPATVAWPDEDILRDLRRNTA